MQDDVILDFDKHGNVTDSESILDFSDVTNRPVLDKYQQAVIDAIDRGEENICVVAGPATGKSRLVVAAPLHLIDKGYEPDTIIIDAFQVSAKNVLDKRLKGTGLHVTTMHGRVLRDSKSARDAFLKKADKDGWVPNFNVLAKLREPEDKYYEWGISDEGQDHTKALHNNFLSWSKRRLLVGDPWQTLFEWAGAGPLHMQKFQKEFCESDKPYELKVNYRSATSIVEAGNIFSGRDIEPNRKDEGIVKVIKCGGGDVPPDLDNITILVSTNKVVTNNWSPYLTRRGIPHTTIAKDLNGRKQILNHRNGKSEVIKDPADFLNTLVCTIYQAKGAEWPRVYVYYTDPVARHFLNEQEEEYVFYVGITRAQDELFVFNYHWPYINKMEGRHGKKK